MYKRVIKTMIALVVVFLIALYILKIFMSEQFIMVIENDNLIAIGNYIDNNLWLRKIIAVITSFITYWLFICAVCRKWKLNLKEIIIVLIVIAIVQLLYLYDANISSTISLVSMVLIPALFKAQSKDIAIVFSIHCIAQVLSTSIRQLPLLLTNTNFMTVFLMTIECYFWLLLFYLYFNIKKE